MSTDSFFKEFAAKESKEMGKTPRGYRVKRVFLRWENTQNSI